MNRDPSVRLMFVVLCVVVFWAAIKVIAPFAPGFIWAAVLVVTFWPVHERLERMFRGRRWMASTTVTIIVAAFVVVPVVVAAVQAVQGGIAVYEWAVSSYQAEGADLGLIERWPWLNDALTRAKGLVGLAHVDFRAATVDGLKRFGAFAAARGPKIVGNAIGIGFSFVVMLGGMLFFFVDGKRFAGAVASALPLPAADAERILRELGDMTRTVFISVGLTAAAQATLGGLALLVLGVPYVLPLTAAMFFFSLLPGGTAIVWAPAALWLALQGHTWKAVLLAVWGAAVVSTIDNILRPVLAGKGVRLNGASLFLGMFGGMIAFGLVGLFLGPIVLYLTRELVAVLRRDVYGPADGSVGSS
jgi:predicted PurR-regulated permease PerM